METAIKSQQEEEPPETIEAKLSENNSKKDKKSLVMLEINGSPPDRVDGQSAKQKNARLDDKHSSKIITEQKKYCDSNQKTGDQKIGDYDDAILSQRTHRRTRNNNKNIALKPTRGLLAKLKTFFKSKNDSDTFRENLENELLKFDQKTDGSISDSERNILRNVLDFGDVRLYDIMVPRADIISIELEKKLSQCLKFFRQSGHSRILIYKKDLDQPIGMIHIKNLVHFLTEIQENQKDDQNEKTKNLSMFQTTQKRIQQTIEQSELLRQVLFVPPSMTAANLLLLMQRKHIHMAVVVDEYGGTDGIVTMENLVEEIIGGIVETNQNYQQQIISDDEIVISARVPPSVVSDIIGKEMIKDEADEDIDTIGGLLSSMVGRVPTRGELIPYPGGLEFEILEADPRRIKKLRVKLAENAVNH